ncbi:TPA: ribonuclease III [Candidatus Saccharibacteria bacterium]|nr:MAG: ribonuclease III [Candidatus Saccharibacteria bacterium RIFCSPHIGHO2_12_FULL_47_17]HCM51559.1 ribonuclease III [Candidatus Saccharibacteria bacterium]
MELLITAFTHRSYLNEHKKSVKEHNERLEFLGDAVLELIVTEHLYTHFREPEGILTNWRSALVRTESISAVAAAEGFESLIRLSRGEKRGSERARQQILANCYEAVIGALYLDQGYEAAKAFIVSNLIPTLKQVLENGLWLDPKSRLQELAQSRDGATPIYRVIEEAGPDHDKTFVVGVFINDEPKGQGSGPSKQAAQVTAAVNALKHYLD